MRKGLVFVLVFVQAVVCIAQQIDVSTALNTAASFLSQQRPQGNLSKKALKSQIADQLQLAERGVMEGKTCYYIFNDGSDGFIIVGGDRKAREILGYSSNGAFDRNNIPEGLNWLLDYYKERIGVAIKLGLRVQEVESSRVKTAAKSDVAMLLTTEWGQGNPYYQQCPKTVSTDSEKSGKPTLTGCVATAISQIMNYHEWPASASLSDDNTYTYTVTSGVTTSFTREFSSTYAWADMADKYTGTDVSTTDAQKNAVATLMSDVGRAMMMEYGPTSSGAYTLYAPKILSEVFGYSKAMRYMDRSFYTDDEWEQMMYDELVAHRPILYRGSDAGGAGGHAFVCDGYQVSDNTFHFNWGWNGSGNGWFAASGTQALEVTPGSTTYAFSRNNEMVIGLAPDKTGTSTTNHFLIYPVSDAKDMKLTSTDGSAYSLNYQIYSINSGNIPLRLKFQNKDNSVVYSEEKSASFSSMTMDYSEGPSCSAFNNLSFTLSETLTASNYDVTVEYNDTAGSWTEIPANAPYNNYDVLCRGDNTTIEAARTANTGTILIEHSTTMGENSVKTYALEYDPSKLHARWVGYTFDATTKEDADISRSNNFQDDPYLVANYPETTAGNATFGSLYDRGHLCASDDRSYSDDANEQTFYMSNMSPQLKQFNEHYWVTLESQIRTIAMDANTDKLYVIKGGNLDGTTTITRANGQMTVPDKYFTALLRKKTGEGGYSAIGFLMDNKNYGFGIGDGNAKLEDIAVTAMNIDALETATGLDFFYNLDDDTENTVEALTVDNALLAEWGFITDAEKVATPSFDPGSKTTFEKEETLSVAIKCATPGATIYYKLDSDTEYSKYTNPISLTASHIITAYATKEGLTQSESRTAQYTQSTKVATPTLSVASKKFTSSFSVSISCSDNEATIYYKLGDGEYTPYSTPISITETTTLSAYASRTDYENSDVVSATYSKSSAMRAQYNVLNFSNVTPSGDIPEGANWTFSSTGTNKSNYSQLQKDEKQTLTLEGYAGKKIIGIELNMKSNQSSGAGAVSAYYDDDTSGSGYMFYKEGRFCDPELNGAYSTSYVWVAPEITAPVTLVNNNADINIIVSASENSLYVEDYRIVYVDAATEVYQISKSSNIYNGSVKIDAQWAAEGEEITLTATPDQNYVFSSWDVRDASGNAVTVTDNKFFMPASKVTVNAVFSYSAAEHGSITIGSTGYATYYTDHAFIMPKGLKGGVAVYNSSSKTVTITYDYEASSVVPGNTGLVLKGSAGTYVYEITTTSNSAPDNQLRGLLSAGTTTGGDVYYKLANGSSGLGFYYGATDGGAFHIGANKAYLALSNAQAQDLSGIYLDDTTTGFVEVAGSKEQVAGEDEVYDLTGRKISMGSIETTASMAPGLVIKNGTKQFIK